MARIIPWSHNVDAAWSLEVRMPPSGLAGLGPRPFVRRNPDQDLIAPNSHVRFSYNPSSFSNSVPSVLKRGLGGHGSNDRPIPWEAKDAKPKASLYACWEAMEAASAEADPTPGRRWSPWKIASIRAVDTAWAGPLRVRYGDSADPRFPPPESVRCACREADWHP